MKKNKFNNMSDDNKKKTSKGGDQGNKPAAQSATDEELDWEFSQADFERHLRYKEAEAERQSRSAGRVKDFQQMAKDFKENDKASEKKEATEKKLAKLKGQFKLK